MAFKNRIQSVDLDARARQSMIENGFEPDFDRGAIDQVAAIESSGGAVTLDGAEDLRNLLWSSIDNRTSRDLDQVEYAERLENGAIRILVGIADVDSVVKKDSPIDRHAEANTVTVYTESEIFPMLPEELSTGRTSLNEGQDRLAVVVELIVDQNGDVPGNKVFRAMVRNQAKLSYEDVGNWIDENAAPPEKFAAVAGLREQIELQLEAAHRLHKFRMEKGALEFESIES